LIAAEKKSTVRIVTLNKKLHVKNIHKPGT
jgi:hypothetical protein